MRAISCRFKSDRPHQKTVPVPDLVYGLGSEPSFFGIRLSAGTIPYKEDFMKSKNKRLLYTGQERKT